MFWLGGISSIVIIGLFSFSIKLALDFNRERKQTQIRKQNPFLYSRNLCQCCSNNFTDFNTKPIPTFKTICKFDYKECDDPEIALHDVVCNTIYESSEDWTPEESEFGLVYKCIILNINENFMSTRPVIPCPGGFKLLNGCNKCANKRYELKVEKFDPTRHAVCPDGLPVATARGYLTKDEYKSLPDHTCNHRTMRISGNLLSY